MTQEELPDIHTQVNEFISKNKERYDIIINLQNILYKLTEESYSSAVKLINDNKALFFNDHSSSIFFFSLIIKSSRFNFKHFEVNLDIIVHYSSEIKNCHTSDFELISISSEFSNSLNYLFAKNFFSIDAIISYSFCDPFVFINFLPEIKQVDPEYAQKHSQNLFFDSSVRNLSYGYVRNPYAKKDRLIEYLKMVETNPEEHIKNRNLNYHPSNLHKIIREDDIDSFQLYLSQAGISVNHRIEDSFYERAKTIEESISLIQISAIYGSIKIFKFLWQSQDIYIEDNLLCYAYCGYNFDIIHLCESDCSLDSVCLQPILLHQDDLLDYFIENCSDSIKEDEEFEEIMKGFENDENNLYQTYLNNSCIEMAFFAINYHVILNCLEKTVFIARNIKNIKTDDKNYQISYITYVDFDLFRFIYNQSKPNFNTIRDTSNSILFDSLKLCKNDMTILIFYDLKDVNQFPIFFEACLECNHDMANYILDLQLEEKKIDNDGPIFGIFKRFVSIDTLHKAICFYNEDIVFKMIVLYDFCERGYAKWFIKFAFQMLSSKMIVPLLKRLSSFAKKTEMQLMKDILCSLDAKYISLFQQYNI